MKNEDKQILDLIKALEPIVKAVKVNDDDTLSSLDSNDKVVWSASGSWASPVFVTLGDLRNIAGLVKAINNREIKNQPIKYSKWEGVRAKIKKEIESHRGETITALLESNIAMSVLGELEELHPCRFFNGE